MGSWLFDDVIFVFTLIFDLPQDHLAEIFVGDAAFRSSEIGFVFAAALLFLFEGDIEPGLFAHLFHDRGEVTEDRQVVGVLLTVGTNAVGRKILEAKTHLSLEFAELGHGTVHGGFGGAAVTDDALEIGFGTGIEERVETVEDHVALGVVTPADVPVGAEDLVEKFLLGSFGGLVFNEERGLEGIEFLLGGFAGNDEGA